MSKLPFQQMVVRNCTGQNAAQFEVHPEGYDSRATFADLFAALASWCDSHPDQFVNAVNVHYDECGYPERLSVLVSQSDTPIPTDGFYVGKTPKPKAKVAVDN